MSPLQLRFHLRVAVAACGLAAAGWAVVEDLGADQHYLPVLPKYLDMRNGGDVEGKQTIEAMYSKNRLGDAQFLCPEGCPSRGAGVDIV